MNQEILKFNMEESGDLVCLKQNILKLKEESYRI